MKPCDCKSEEDTKKLEVQGISINEWSLSVNPNIVLLEHQYYGNIKMPMKIFRTFAEWYLSKQEENNG